VAESVGVGRGDAEAVCVGAGVRVGADVPEAVGTGAAVAGLRVGPVGAVGEAASAAMTAGDVVGLLLHPAAGTIAISSAATVIRVRWVLHVCVFIEQNMIALNRVDV